MMQEVVGILGVFLICGSLSFYSPPLGPLVLGGFFVFWAYKSK